MGGYVALAFAELFPEYLKGLVLMNSTARADSAERKTNRDRAIIAVKKDYTAFVRLSIANLFSEDNRNTMTDEIDRVKLEALQTPLQGIIAALEGMKIRKDREVLLHQTSFPKMLILGKKDGVLQYEENATQIEGTDVQLISLADGHMSHIENKIIVKINPGYQSNDVLKYLLQENINIVSYNELLPSLNDIFIHLVENTHATARAFQNVQN